MVGKGASTQQGTREANNSRGRALQTHRGFIELCVLTRDGRCGHIFSILVATSVPKTCCVDTVRVSSSSPGLTLRTCYRPFDAPTPGRPSSRRTWDFSMTVHRFGRPIACGMHAPGRSVFSCDGPLRNPRRRNINYCIITHVSDGGRKFGCHKRTGSTTQLLRNYP